MWFWIGGSGFWAVEYEFSGFFSYSGFGPLARVEPDAGGFGAIGVWSPKFLLWVKSGEPSFGWLGQLLDFVLFLWRALREFMLIVS